MIQMVHLNQAQKIACKILIIKQNQPLLQRKIKIKRKINDYFIDI